MCQLVNMLIGKYLFLHLLIFAYLLILSLTHLLILSLTYSHIKVSISLVIHIFGGKSEFFICHGVWR